MTDQIPGAQDWACVTACHRRDAHPVRLGVPAVTASAAPVPVIYNYAAGWSNPAVRPHRVIIGQGGAPIAHTWWWNTWNSTVAKSAGTLWVDNCIPNCALGKTSYQKLYVTLSGVKWHKGWPYYSVDSVTGWSRPHRSGRATGAPSPVASRTRPGPPLHRR